MSFWSCQKGLDYTIAIHILPNISRSKGNQTMKFGQLMEYNMTNIFLVKSYKKRAGETSQTFFYKIKIKYISRLINSLNCIWANLRAIEVYWKKAAAHLRLPYIKLFSKTKIGLELVSLPHFLHNFWRKISLLLYSIDWPNFIAWLPLIREIWVICVL